MFGIGKKRRELEERLRAAQDQIRLFEQNHIQVSELEERLRIVNRDMAQLVTERAHYEERIKHAEFRLENQHKLNKQLEIDIANAPLEAVDPLAMQSLLRRVSELDAMCAALRRDNDSLKDLLAERVSVPARP